MENEHSVLLGSVSFEIHRSITKSFKWLDYYLFNNRWTSKLEIIKKNNPFHHQSKFNQCE